MNNTCHSMPCAQQMMRMDDMEKMDAVPLMEDEHQEGERT